MSQVIDLFKTDKQALLDFIVSKKRVKTSEVLNWGTKNYSNRARNNAQDLCAKGIIFRLREDLKMMYFGDINEGVYTIYESEGAVKEMVV